jgi:PPOX class probable F420-dependent enzyme
MAALRSAARATATRRVAAANEDRRVDEEEARRRLASARVARLATAGHDGQPHLVPVTFALDGELVYIAIDHKPKTTRRLRRLRNIAENPHVALLADEYSDDWSQLWWVRVDGVARVVTDALATQHPIDVLAARYPQYRADRPDGPVIVIAVEKWTAWSAA